MQILLPLRKLRNLNLMNGNIFMKIMTLLITFLSLNAMALSPDAEKGKAAIAVCLSCHNEELNPPLAPPLYGVQNKYKQTYNDKQGFVDAISNWVKSPSLDGALMRRPIQKLGLMPAMPLPDDMLASIAAYIYEQEFEAPCTHWANDLANSSSNSPKLQGNGRGKGRGNNHDAMIRMKYNQLCK